MHLKSVVSQFFQWFLLKIYRLGNGLFSLFSLVRNWLLSVNDFIRIILIIFFLGIACLSTYHLIYHRNEIDRLVVVKTAVETKKEDREEIEHLVTSRQEDTPDYSYVIQEGDNLNSIFTHLGFSYNDMMKVLEADLNFLSLDTLQPGNTLQFWKTADNEYLLKMVLIFNIAEKVVFERLDDGSYEYSNISIDGEWRPIYLAATIQGSFSVSAQRIGLTATNIDHIVTLLKDKLNFTRDLRAGDKFELVQNQQFVDGIATGKTELQAIKIYNKSRVIAAYLHSDGQYYNRQGNSLQRAFQRLPTSHAFRISSSFNPTRRHPITKRISPHNGTDFATPIGTAVKATGDGTVVIARDHPYAGKYVVIKHNDTYMTRYLHLSKILVKNGQKVVRGQKIALSGNSGRSTGPHLHYELIIKGHAVNAMSANIPMAYAVSKQEMDKFTARRDQLDLFMKSHQR